MLLKYKFGLTFDIVVKFGKWCQFARMSMTGENESASKFFYLGFGEFVFYSLNDPTYFIQLNHVNDLV